MYDDKKLFQRADFEYISCFGKSAFCSSEKVFISYQLVDSRILPTSTQGPMSGWVICVVFLVVGLCGCGEWNKAFFFNFSTSRRQRWWCWSFIPQHSTGADSAWNAGLDNHWLFVVRKLSIILQIFCGQWNHQHDETVQPHPDTAVRLPRRITHRTMLCNCKLYGDVTCQILSESSGHFDHTKWLWHFSAVAVSQEGPPILQHSIKAYQIYVRFQWLSERQPGGGYRRWWDGTRLSLSNKLRKAHVHIWNVVLWPGGNGRSCYYSTAARSCQVYSRNQRTLLDIGQGQSFRHFFSLKFCRTWTK